MSGGVICLIAVKPDESSRATDPARAITGIF
jgi:hypothetical protein